MEMIKIKVFIGVDHNGVKLKELIAKYLDDNGIENELVSINNTPDDDYPDIAYDVCKKVLDANGLGILVCGTGIGMSIAANKVKGIKCARVIDEEDAITAKNHNGANVIAFSSKLKVSNIKKIIDAFILTRNPSEERHIRRVSKIDKFEE